MLGLVATGKRSIKAGAKYNGLFPPSKGMEVELLADGDVHDTIGQMKKIVNHTLPQTKAIATELKGQSLQATSKNIWDFLYNHVQYKKDNPLREQLRTPSRTWKDRASGVDCDCYSIFISSVLSNLGIPHAFRMAGYKGDYQHVYVVVPKNGKAITDRSSYYVIDPVVNKFDYEVPFSKKHDTMRVTALNGFGSCENAKPTILKLRPFIATQEVIDKGGVPAKEFMIANGIQFAPSFDQDGDRSVYVVNTANGLISVPTVLSPVQADELKKMAGACATAPTESTADKVAAAAKKFNWWWLVAAAGVMILFTGSDQDEVKTGLSGVPGGESQKKKKAPKAISL